MSSDTAEMIWPKRRSCKLCAATTTCLGIITVYFLLSAIYEVRFGYLKNSNVLADYFIGVGNKLGVRKLQDAESALNVEVETLTRTEKVKPEQLIKVRDPAKHLNTEEIIRNSVKSDQEIKKSINGEERIKHTVSGAERIKDSVKSAERIKDSVKSAERIKDSVKSAERIKDSVKSAERIKDSVKSAERIKDSVKSAERIKEIKDSAYEYDPANLPPPPGIIPHSSGGSSLVPNLVHFVWMTSRPRSLMFTEMISVLSAHKKQEPDKILLHCNHAPSGKWWDELINKFNVKISIVHVDFPLVFGGHVINSTQEAGDVRKFLALQEHGGIYLAFDVVMVNPLDNLRGHEFTVGQSQSGKVSSAVMLSAPNSTFTREVLRDLELQERSTSGVGGGKDLIAVLTSLARKHHKSVTLETETLTFPEHERLLYTENHHVTYWRKYPVIRLAYRQGENKIYTPQYIKRLTNLIGSVLRLIYTGSADAEDKWLPHIYYSINLTMQPQ